MPRHPILRFGLLLLALTALQAHPSAAQAPAQLAVDWNAQVLAVAEAEDGFLTLKGLRTATMMHLAMHDALSAIHGRYAPYGYEAAAPKANPVAAATQAALVVARAQYPDRDSVFLRLRNQWLVHEPHDEAYRQGLLHGEAAARAILTLRADDGWDNEADYQWHPMGPGVYAEFNEHSGTPQGFIFGAGWGTATPFGLPAPDHYVAPPPPAIESPAYTEAFNEVKAVGRFQSMDRTPDQTHLALWWKDFAENSHNRLARELIIETHLDLPEATRLLALLNMSIFDAYVSSFHNKFLYNHWRPYTAIRWAAHDGNPDTAPEPTWTNTHQHTYAFPSYPSAHGTACAAAMTALADTFGEAYPFTMTTDHVDLAGPFSGKIEMRPPTRTFAGFSEAAEECGWSRVYLGIHFRYDSVEGVALGRKVGSFAVANHLTRSQ